MPTPKVSPELHKKTQDAVTKYGSVKAAAKALNTAESTIRRRLRHAPRDATAKKVGRSLADFRGAHDKSFIVPQKIRAALRELGEAWEYEQQFLRLAGVNAIDLNAYRPQFEDHVVLIERTKRVWCGTISFAARLRELV